MKFYITSGEFLDKNKEVIEGIAFYYGRNLNDAIYNYDIYYDDYIICRRSKKYLSIVYYFSLVLFEFDVPDDCEDSFIFSELIADLYSKGEFNIIKQNGDYYA